MVSVNIFSFLSNNQVSLISNVPHLNKITFTNCADKSVSRFQTLRTFLVKIQVNQQGTGKVSNSEQ